MRHSGRNSGKWIAEMVMNYPIRSLALVGIVSLAGVLFGDRTLETPALSQQLNQAREFTGNTSTMLSGAASVVDGDSLRLNGTEIRLWGIDSPELSQQCLRRGQVWPCGMEAKEQLSQQLAEASVTCQPLDTDHYGRTIAECFVGEANLNQWLVANGWALAYRRYSEKFVPAEDQARIAGRGIWQGEFTEPWEWRQQQRQ